MDEKYRLPQIPKTMRTAYEKRSQSRKYAIIAMCQECTGYVRADVKHCTDQGCPLWHFRPYQDKQS